MKDCIFCKIVAGDIQSHKVFESQHVLAFLDIYPPLDGFTIVIPKKHSEYIWDMHSSDYKELMKVVKKIGNQIGSVLKPKRVGVHIEGLDVNHTHVKVFPFNTHEEFQSIGDTSKDPDHKALEAMAARLKIL